MKARLFLLTILAFFTAVLLAFSFDNTNNTSSGETIVTFKKKNIVRCGPDWEALKEFFEETDIPPIPGAGTHQWKISTTNDSAQFYFNQGMNMYYSFHIIEAMASFKKAAKFDPSCAMLYWAQALSYGPNINDLGYAASPEALAATQKAKQFAGTANKIEKALIEAMVVRYTADSTDVNRAKLNQLYTEMMRKLDDKFGDNPDVKALYADAMMLQHPWDLWKNDGTPKPWTPQIRNVLEKLLAKSPNHPGANHYYIHLMEPSPYYAKAIPSADRLGKLTPGLSHTVHMPSHIYLRSGNYQKGIDVNINAVNRFEKAVSLYEPVSGNAFLYVIHNLHMQTNNAMLAGLSAKSEAFAKETAESIPVEYLTAPGALGNYIQYVYSVPVLVDIRFGNWKKLLAYPLPDAAQRYRNILYHFGRGMALTHQSKLPEARSELRIMQLLMKDSTLLIPFTPFSAAIDGATVAENILAGTIALKDEKNEEAITAFQKAVTVEENMVYSEPRDWLLNPKHYLGNAFIRAKRYDDAKDVFLKDLKNNSENGWALFGMWQALAGDNKRSEAAKMMARFNLAFKGADIKLQAAVY